MMFKEVTGIRIPESRIVKDAADKILLAYSKIIHPKGSII